MISPELLQDLQQQEEELGARGRDLVPKGHYLMSIDSNESEVSEFGGYPVLSPVATIMGGVYEKRFVNGKKMWWFASETSKSDKSFEERQEITRRIARQTLLGYAYQILGNPGADDSLAELLNQQIKDLDTDDPAEVKEVMGGILSTLEGVQFVGVVTHTIHTDDRDKPKDEQRTYAEYVPYVYTGGKRKSVPVDVLLESFSRGLEKANVVSDADLANV